MAKIKQKLKNLMVGLYVHIAGSSLKQGENLAPEGEQAATPHMAEKLRRAAAEGAVLLKNDGILPLKDGCALFGRVQTDTFYTGYGSGGDVVKPYRVSILEGLERANVPLAEGLKETYKEFQAAHPVNHGYWGNWPRNFPEMPLDKETVQRAREERDTAVVVIGRAAGEDREMELTKGSYYLTPAEENMLQLVTEVFEKVAVVLNIGNIIDLTFLERYKIGAALLLWQGGMETGNACADLLTGKVCPCGKLPDTVAREYEDYPSAKNFGNADYNEYVEDIYVGYRHFETSAKEKVLFPFGHGLSYTSFSLDASFKKGQVRYRVKNTGKCAGRTVVQVYLKKPSGTRGTPARELVGFVKTGLLAPNKEEKGEIELPERALCVFDERTSSLVIERGMYVVYVGFDVRTADMVGTFSLEGKTFASLKEQCAPQKSFRVEGETGNRHRVCRAAEKDLKAEISGALPAFDTPAPAREVSLSDVREGRASLEQFAAQLSLQELEDLSRGDFKMDSPLGASGNAGVMGGVTEALRARGIPPVTMTDGPSGIRLKAASSLLPIGTLLASTFDPALVEEVYAAVGGEMKERGTDVLLAPAMNIHRSILCGRNFEYFSEDPYLTGKLAAAVVKGVQSAGVSACPKHFACNNQEFNRNHYDSRVSQRALREIYLYGFEICVKEAAPHFLMTSYNKVNGVYAHYNYELVRGILRGEWGFEGCVVTDWWMRKGASPHFSDIKNNAYRVRAGVNVLMPGGAYLGKKMQCGSLLPSVGKEEGLTEAELRRNAVEILRAVLKTSAMQRSGEGQHVVP